MIARRLILASASPRRRQLLAEAGFQFEIHPADIDEERHPDGLSPGELAQWLAAQKAAVVAERFPDAVVLAADTVVALGEQLLGKPRDAQHATQMLQTLSGTTHQVTTGVAVVCKADGFAREDCVESSVHMREMSPREIADYVATGQWEGKAGGYGIQDQDPFVTRIAGDLTNIVGLPMQRTIAMLKEAGIGLVNG
jgi:septum formation protein